MKKKLNEFRKLLLKPFCTGYIFVPVIETVLISIYISEFYIPLFVLWILAVSFFNFSYKVTLSLATYYLFFSLFFIYRNETFFANRLSIWFYLFLLFSFFQFIVEIYIFPRNKKEEVLLFPALVSQVHYVVYESKKPFIVLIFSLVFLTVNSLISHARYFFWFFTFSKFERYIQYTALYQLFALTILSLIIFWALREKINFRLVLVTFSFTSLFAVNLIFYLSTRTIQIVGDEPKVAEVNQDDQFLFIYGHNFRRWPNQYSSVYIDNQPQDIIFWSHDLIVLPSSTNSSTRTEILITNPLRYKSQPFTYYSK